LARDALRSIHWIDRFTLAPPNLSPGAVTRLTAGWQQDYERWQGRNLSARRYVYVWADRVYLQARMGPAAECMLVLTGFGGFSRPRRGHGPASPPEGKKELIGFQVGARESAQSWRELLADLKGRRLSTPPEIAVGDGALG
jgi:transposase-like protein